MVRLRPLPGLPPELLAARLRGGPLPIAVPATAEAYLAERHVLLDRRLAEVADKAAADRLEDVRLAGGEMRISPLHAATPDEAEVLAGRLYGMVPAVRVTDLLAEVDRWTGFSRAFTHLHTGLPADDSRIVLTAVLADATNFGVTRMADACAVASYRQLAWTAGWHLCEETYRRALAVLVNPQQSQPLAAHFGAADVSGSDGQHFPTEYASERRRGLCVVLMSVGYPIGATLGGMAAVYLIQIWGWCSVYAFGGLVATCGSMQHEGGASDLGEKTSRSCSVSPPHSCFTGRRANSASVKANHPASAVVPMASSLRIPTDASR